MKTVAQVRADMPVLAAKVFLNAGSLCPTPTPVMEAYFSSYREWHARGAGHPAHYEAMRGDVTGAAKVKLAKLLNCQPEEMTLTANATEGVNIVAFGLDWKPGDEVIITDAEHPANSVVWLHNQDRFGIKLRFLPAYHEPETLLNRLEALINERTRLVAVSHVLSATGRILPVADMARLTHQNRSLLLVDGAHAVGQMRVDLKDLQCDFYTTNGHKWLFGPAGTGLLFVRQELQALVRPSFVGDTGGKALDNREGGSYTPPPDGRRYEYATRNWPLYEALGLAVDYVNEIGLDNIRQRVSYLTVRFKADLATLPGLDMWSPSHPDESAGLVCFGLCGKSAPEISAYLETRGILLRHVTDHLLRASLGYFTLEEELDLVIDELRRYLCGEY